MSLLLRQIALHAQPLITEFPFSAARNPFYLLDFLPFLGLTLEYARNSREKTYAEKKVRDTESRLETLAAQVVITIERPGCSIN